MLHEMLIITTSIPDKLFVSNKHHTQTTQLFLTYTLAMPPSYISVLRISSCQYIYFFVGMKYS